MIHVSLQKEAFFPIKLTIFTPPKAGDSASATGGLSTLGADPRPLPRLQPLPQQPRHQTYAECLHALLKI